MSCESVDGDYGDALTSGGWMDAFFCPMYDQVGVELTALIIVGAIAIAMYRYSDSVDVPMVLAILTGGIVIPRLPSLPIRLFVVVLLIAVPLAAIIWIRRMDRSFA